MPDSLAPSRMGLPVNISMAVFATYSVVGIVLVQVCGFVIATNYYTKAGVPPASIPLMTLSGAGLCFAVITGYYFYVGAAMARMAPRATSLRDTLELTLYGLTMGGVFYILLIFFLVRWPGPGIYFSICGLVGWGYGRAGAPSYWFRVSGDEIRFPDFARAFLPILAALWFFSEMVYPNLSRAVGGAAPIPVGVHLTPEAQVDLVPGSELYEVLSDGSFVYLEMLLPPGTSTDEDRGFLGLLEGPPRRYVQIPLSAVRSMLRLRPFQQAPTVQVQASHAHGASSTSNP